MLSSAKAIASILLWSLYLAELVNAFTVRWGGVVVKALRY
jgi:hypothetical protein